MSQATAIRSPIVEGRLEAQRDGKIILDIPDTDYRLHLVCPAPPHAAPEERSDEGAGMGDTPVPSEAKGRVSAALETPTFATAQERRDDENRPFIRGTIHVNARRVDSLPSGARYIEPSWGRPRRIQGRIIAGDVAANTITVDCVVPVIVTLMPSQHAGDFFLGQMVSFDAEAGGRFKPV